MGINFQWGLKKTSLRVYLLKNLLLHVSLLIHEHLKMFIYFRIALYIYCSDLKPLSRPINTLQNINVIMYVIVSGFQQGATDTTCGTADRDSGFMAYCSRADKKHYGCLCHARCGQSIKTLQNSAYDLKRGTSNALNSFSTTFQDPTQLKNFYSSLDFNRP